MEGPGSPERPGTFTSRLRGAEMRLQERLLIALGVAPTERQRVVALMQERRRDAVGYWLQLGLSMGIATLGLALGSTAVVIGAMLIAPLMGPIVELGMALVIGSPSLTLRSLARMSASVVAVVGGAALLTLLLPFREITPEISSRTVPTALDLLVAVFVALVAVYTTVRSTSETTSAAAGTAIGIALVPPVCVIGYGIGIGDGRVAGGAALLFVTNLTAILFISVVSFWALGFEHVSAAEWERAARAEARPGSLMQRSMARLERLFGSRYSRIVRVGIPALLIAVTYVPLRRALDQVAWEVRARSAVSRIITQALDGRSAVQAATHIAGRAIHAEVYVVGTPEAANVLRDHVRTRIAAETGVVPSLEVTAVPDLATVRSLTAAPATPPREVPPATSLPDIREETAAAVREEWPAEVGALLGWRLLVADSAADPVVEAHYLGAPTTGGTEALFARVLSERLSVPVRFRGVPLPPEPETAPIATGVEWLPRFLDAARAAAALPGLHACVAVPVPESAGERIQVARIEAVVRREAERLPRVALAEGGREWSVRLRRAGCQDAEDAEEEAPATVGAPEEVTPTAG